MRSRILLLTVIAGLAGGCATLDRSECETGDWTGIGYSDGAAGFKQSRLGIHTKACARHSIAPDQSAYQIGFTRGLYDFCLPTTGYRLGLESEPYHYLCPVDTEDAFLVAYSGGLERNLAMLEWRYNWLDHRYDVNRFSYQRHADSATSSERERQRNALDSIDSELDDLKFERIRLRGLLSRARTHLTKLRQEIGSK